MSAKGHPHPRRVAVPVREYLLFAEAAAWCLLAALLLAVLPFRRVMSLVGSSRSTDRRSSHPAEAVADLQVAINRAARRLPVRIVCIQRACAMQWALRRRGVASHLHYGISRDPADLKAHVWLTVGDQIVMGAEERLHYACVAHFPPNPPAIEP